MKPTKYQQRLKRGHRVRQQIGAGTAAKPRFVVFRSNTAISAQIVNDDESKTIVAASSQKAKAGGNVEAAKKVGAEIAKKAKEAKVTQVVFDRSGYKFHGRIKALADAAREGGLQF